MTEQDKKDIKEVLDLIADCLETEEINCVPIPTDWLAEHDKKVREDTIDEIDKMIGDMIVYKGWCIADLCEKDINCDDCAISIVRERLIKLKEKGAD